MKNITVIGGGSTGYAATAYFASKGFDVTLCDKEEFHTVLQDVEDNGGILLRGIKERGLYQPVMVTSDFARALQSAEFVMVCVPARRQDEIAELIGPHLPSGVPVLLTPGNLGSFSFIRILKKYGVDPERNIVAEMEGNLCPCRITGKAEVTVGLPIRTKKVAALPGSKTAAFIEQVKEVLDMIPNRNVFEGALLSDNYVLHIGTTLLSSSKIEDMGSEYIMFQHGLCEAAVSCTEAIRAERQSLLECFGLTERDSATEFFRELQNWQEHPEYTVFRTLDGPDKLNHRYLSEDSWACGALALSCADRLGIKMPTLAAVIQLASMINGEMYAETGRNLHNLGFDDSMTMEEIVKQIS